MRLIIDANELFSFFNKKSKARELSLLPKIKLYSPMFVIEEINKYKKDISKKFNLTELQFKIIEKLFYNVINIVGIEEFSEFIKEAETISPDPKDVEYFALALKLNCPIWSEDKKLKNQDKVEVLSTSEILKIFN